MDDIKISSNRSFGIVFFIVFLLIALYPLTYDEEIRVWSVIISLIFLVLGLLNSKILTPLNKLWFKFGILLGKVVSPLIMIKGDTTFPNNIPNLNQSLFKGVKILEFNKPRTKKIKEIITDQTLISSS